MTEHAVFDLLICHPDHMICRPRLLQVVGCGWHRRLHITDTEEHQPALYIIHITNCV